MRKFKDITLYHLSDLHGEDRKKAEQQIYSHLHATGTGGGRDGWSSVIQATTDALFTARGTLVPPAMVAELTMVPWHLREIDDLEGNRG